MDSYQETFATWNKVASRYQELFMPLDLYNETYDFICHSMPKDNSKLLEIGCGPGNITKYLLSKRPDFYIYGIDIAPNMIELARKNNPSAQFSVMDCRQIDTLQTTYDAIICGFCLPYLSQEDTGKFIHDCAALLHESGLIYISFVEGNPDQSGFQVGSTGDRAYFYFHRLDKIIQHLEQNKLEQIKVVHVNYKKTENEMEMHTIVTAKKIAIAK
ncbi:trans-aconitate 2-methyltransferase [Flavobacterium sp.]|uniref:class I SAM-dependent methyltransferase n=1 Tax=Flavobacterium sp. TaxID=239 RepID=UPI003526E5D0